MAWTDIGSGPGVWGGLSLSEPAGSSTPDLKQIMLELITAIYEREEIMKDAFGTYTSDNEKFRKAGGTLHEGDAFTSISDFDGMTIRGDDSDYLYNLLAMQDGVEALVERRNCIWNADAITRDDWLNNQGDLLSLGSFGSSWLDPTDGLVAELDVIHQIREALDALIYPIYGLRLGTESGINQQTIRRKRSSEGDYDEHWANMIGEDWESGGSANSAFEASINCSNGIFGAEYSETLSIDPGKFWETADLKGTLLESIYVVATNGAIYSGAIAAGNSKFSKSFGVSDFAQDFEYTVDGWPNIGTNTEAEEGCGGGIPGSDPFTSSGSAQIWAGRKLASSQTAYDMKSAANIKKYTRAYCQLVPGTDLTFG